MRSDLLALSHNDTDQLVTGAMEEVEHVHSVLIAQFRDKQAPSRLNRYNELTLLTAPHVAVMVMDRSFNHTC